MTTNHRVSIDEMLQWDTDKLARGLVSLQMTQREAKVLFYTTPKGAEGSEGGPRDYVDSIEYDYLRGLPVVPEDLLSYLRKDFNSRRWLLEASRFLISNAREIAAEIVSTRGPLPVRIEDSFGEHSFPGGQHEHYRGQIPPACVVDKVLEDTAQSLKDYAESIGNVR